MNVANMEVLPITNSIFQWVGSHEYSLVTKLEIEKIMTDEGKELFDGYERTFSFSEPPPMSLSDAPDCPSATP